MSGDYIRPVIYQYAKDIYIVQKTFFADLLSNDDIQTPPVYFGSKRTAQMYIYHGIIKELISDPELFIESLGKNGGVLLYRRPKPNQSAPTPYLEITMEEAKIYE